MQRRDFIKYLGLGSAALTLSPVILSAATTPTVVVVGGGFSGATAAKYLKMWGGSSVNVVLIEPNATYYSPILSNLVLNNQKSLYQFNYNDLASKYGVSIINKSVNSIDANAKSLTLNDGSKVAYDKLILATGIDFIQVNSYDFNKVPHAWIAGEQTTILKNQIDSMQDGDTFVLTIPKSPYRCPPGPYERACVVADYLKNTKGLNCNVIVLDENSDIIVEKDSFLNAFNDYGVDYRANSTIVAVDDVNLSVTYNNGSNITINADVLNVIPRQKAARLVVDSALTDSTNFAPVNLLNYESTLVKDIHIIGDSHKSSQPKAGHIANSEAKICADAVLRELSGSAPYAKPKTNSACYSPISKSEATWLSAVYEYNAASNDMVKVYGGAGVPSTQNYSDMFKWTTNLFSDTFA